MRDAAGDDLPGLRIDERPRREVLLGVRGAADEGCAASAVAGYRDAFRAYRQLGLAFDEAMAVVDLATLLPEDERRAADLVKAVDEARETLERLGSRPFLARLDGVRPVEAAR